MSITVDVDTPPPGTVLQYRVDTGPLDDGAELFRFVTDTGEKVEVELNPMLEIAFGEGLLRQRHLIEIGGHVSKLLSEMAELFGD